MHCVLLRSFGEPDIFVDWWWNHEVRDDQLARSPAGFCLVIQIYGLDLDVAVEIADPWMVIVAHEPRIALGGNELS